VSNVLKAFCGFGGVSEGGRATTELRGACVDGGVCVDLDDLPVAHGEVFGGAQGEEPVAECGEGVWGGCHSVFGDLCAKGHEPLHIRKIPTQARPFVYMTRIATYYIKNW
jgi:hypothetical protein